MSALRTIEPPPGQMQFDFIAEMDFASTEERARQEADSHRRNMDAILDYHLRDYPITPVEKSWLPAGVRLMRHVHPCECEVCTWELQTADHSQNWSWGQPVCLKDVLAQESELGRPLKSTYVKPSLRRRNGET